MQVNTEFWGEEIEWLTPSNATLQSAGVKTINFNTATLPDYWSSGYRATGERSYSLDEPPKPEQTPTAWGIGKLSALSNPLYGFAGYSNTATGSPYSDASVTPYTRDMRLDKNTPLSMCPQCYSYGVGSDVGWTYRVYPNGSANNCVCGGVTKFNYQNIVVYPMLKVCKKVPHSTSYKYGIQERSGYVSISDYFDGNSPVKDEYPYIMAVIIGNWYMGGQPVYNNGVYVSGQRNSYVGNNFSLRFNEPLKGTEYNTSVRMWYQGQERERSPQIQEDFYIMYPTVLYDSCLSGYYQNRIGHLYSMENYTIADDIEKAWTLSTNGNFPPIAQNGHYDIEAIQEYDGTNYTRNYIVVALWENATKDEVLRDVAFLGFWFSEDATTAQRALTGELCFDNKMHIPVFDSKGVTTGEWKSGTDAANEPNAKWNDPFNDSPYNPQGGGGDDDFGDLENIHTKNRYPTTLNIYLMSGAEYANFVQAVNGIYANDPQGVSQWTLDFNGANPSDYIVASYATALDLPTQSNSVHPKLGNITTPFDNITAYLLGADNGIFDCGSIQFNAYYNDFRDYAPYTTAQLYIPLCGTVDIEPEFFVGHSVNVVYFYDVLTMSLAAGIYRDAYTLYKVVNGSAGAEIPLTSMRMGDYQNAIHNIEQSLKRNDFNIAMSTFTAGASLVGAVASGGATLATGAGIVGGGGGLISNLMAKQDLQYQMQHTVPKPSGTTAAEAQNGFCVGSFYPILFIKRAKMQSGYDANIYSHTVGNACLIQSKIKDMSGLIKCSNVDLSGIPATAEEINAIQTALQNGVYV